MVKHYIKSAWRSIRKGKLYSIINISGLSLGMAMGIMLLLWVQNELSYDRFNKNLQQIYRVNTEFRGQQNAGKEVVYAMTPAKIQAAAVKLPQVKAATRVINDGQQTFAVPGSGATFNLNCAYVDKSFLDIFTYPLTVGNVNLLWKDPHSIVLTASVAGKIFGATDVMGKSLVLGDQLMRVSGVIKDFPSNSSLQAEVLLPMSYYAAQYSANHQGAAFDEDRQNFGMATFLWMHDKADKKVVADALNKQWTDMGDKRFDFQLQPLQSLHLVEPNGQNSQERMVQIFIIIVGMLFLIASINYINLSTARSLVRAKEVGIKKIIGARKSQLFKQFFLETVMIFVIALVMATGVIYLLMPFYNYIAGKELHFSLTDPVLVKTLLIALGSTLLLSGIYPAVLLSRFKPLGSIKGKISTHLSAGNFRRGLVVFQFLMSAVLLFMTLVMGKQLSYIQHMNTGYDKDYVLTVAFPEKAIPHMEAIRDKLASNSSIESVGTSNAENIADLYVSTTGMKWPGKDPNSTFFIYTVSIDAAFIPAMKMQLEAGQNFSNSAIDSTGIILNQTAVAQMGLKAPYIGQQVNFGSKKFSIIGVVKDFNFQSLRSEVSPLVFYVNPASINTVYVRTSSSGVKPAINALKQAYEPYRTNEAPFSYQFLDKQFEALYKSDIRVGMLFVAFASMAILISCLGLFGLVTFNAEVRIKEIGIRRVLGASVSSIVGLLCKEFFLLVLLAVLIATPLCYLLTGKWLSGFAYRTTVGGGVLCEVILILGLLTFMTTTIRVIRAARSKISEHLKSE